MPPQGRLADLGKGDPHGHGCPACPHPVVGPLILGSPNVFVNGMPAGRKTDMGMAAACCGPMQWVADAGSGTVEINGLAAFRKDDMLKNCGGAGTGKLIQGSPNVTTGG